MRFRDRVRLWKIERHLRRLQDAYYDATVKDDNVIAEYLRTLAEARQLYLAGTGRREDRRRRLHVGSGGHRIAGWINADIDPAAGVDLVTDLTRPLPFRSDSLDLIHSEDVIEHLHQDAGHQFLRECHRVLRTGGVMRLVTPDLQLLIRRIYIDRNEHHLRWCGAYLEAEGACEALNMHLRMNGEHRFVYDEELLTRVSSEIGFNVRRVRFNQSSVPELRYLDLRDFGLNLFVECTKR